MAIDGGAKSQDTCAPHARHGCQTGGLSNGVYEVSSKQSIAELAYHLWNARGRPHGSEEEDWLEAERRLATAKEADREGGGPGGASDATLNLDASPKETLASPKETLPAPYPAAGHSPEISSSNVRNRSNSGDKKNAPARAPGRKSRTEAKSTLKGARASDSAGKAAASREVSNPPVDETDDAPETAPHDIGEG